MKTVLFYWSKGADTRVRILKEIRKCAKGNEPCYLNTIAANMKLSHVGIKKHIDILIEEGYIRVINPGGKPLFLELTESGNEVLDEFEGKKKGR